MFSNHSVFKPQRLQTTASSNHSVFKPQRLQTTASSNHSVFKLQRPRRGVTDINAGALVVADELCGIFDQPKQAVLDFVRKLASDETIDFDYDVARAETETGFTNRALANLLRANGNLRHDVDQVLDVYFHQCSIAMSTSGLARAYRFLANRGAVPTPGGPEGILSQGQCRRLNALMLTCGFYDQAGEFAYSVGLPGKSGVDGGIAVAAPDAMAVAVWSPRLNSFGNSAFGVRALTQFTTATGISIF
jgi:glutaminase